VSRALISDTVLKNALVLHQAKSACAGAIDRGTISTFISLFGGKGSEIIRFICQQRGASKGPHKKGSEANRK